MYGGQSHATTHVEVRGQVLRVRSLLPQCGFPGLNSGGLAQLQESIC